MSQSLSRCRPCLLVCCLLTLLLSAPLHSIAQREFRYQNPIASVSLRDPQITKVDG